MTGKKTVQIEAPDAWNAKVYGQAGPAPVLLAYAQSLALVHFDEGELRQSEKRELADRIALGMDEVVQECRRKVASAVHTAELDFLAKNPEAKKAYRPNR